MKLRDARAGEGVTWIGRGCQMFVRQPFGLASLFSICLAVSLLNVVPVLGPFLPFVVWPTMLLLFMISARRIENGERAFPEAIQALRGGDRKRLFELLKLGLAFARLHRGDARHRRDRHTLAAWFESVRAAMALPEPAPPPPPDQRALWAALTMPLVMVLISIPFWHAPGLVFWGRQSWFRSLFFSTLAIWRNKGAFLLYGLAGFGLLVAFILMLNTLAALLGVRQAGSMAAGVLAVSAFSLYMTLMYTSVWFTFAGCFEFDDGPAHAEPTPA